MASAPGAFGLSFRARSAGSMGCQSSTAGKAAGIARYAATDRSRSASKVRTNLVIGAPSVRIPEFLSSRGAGNDTSTTLIPKQVSEGETTLFDRLVSIASVGFYWLVNLGAD